MHVFVPPDQISAARHDLRFLRDCGLLPEHWQSLCAHARSPALDPLDFLLAEGWVDEIQLLACLARHLGATFSLSPPPPLGDSPAEEAYHFDSYRALCADIDHPAGRLVRVIAPRAALIRMLLGQKMAGRLPAIILTPRQIMLDQLVHADRERLLWRANTLLPAQLSARSTEGSLAPPWYQRWWRHLAALSALLIMMSAIGPALLAPWIVLPFLLAPVFILASIALLTAASEALWGIKAQPGNGPPKAYPRYSLLIPLYKETEVIAALIKRIAALQYPRDRIEVFFLVEADDRATRTALENAGLKPWMRVITVPQGQPKTKPRALNVALPFASGDLLVVYDAEDEPETDQLLKAACLFETAPADVACVQARLAISNPRDGFLSSRFAIEYATLFDLVKAGSARLGWPVPLGGSSNHFRVAALRSAGARDAWNVTEDADLGLRLARFGWRVDDLVSTTWEEAPNTLPSWFNQRTRWMKGWLQTGAVLLRNPLRTWREFGWFNALILMAMATGVIVGALLYPAFMLALVIRLMSDVPFGDGEALMNMIDAMIVVSITFGIIVETIPPIIAIRQRGGMFLLPFVFLAPLSHCLIAAAGWRALYEWFRNPFHWHKTMHGLARKLGGLSMLGTFGKRRDD